MSLRILLADDHVIVRQGVKSLLTEAGYQVVGEATDGREAVQLSRDLHPDIALLDLAMPVMNGVDAAREILRGSRQTKPILLTSEKEGSWVAEAFRAGVRGYVLKSQSAAELCQAIREVGLGATYISPAISATVFHTDVEPILSRDRLTPREREILQLIAEGKSSKEIAVILSVSSNTVESHRSRMMKKLAIHDRVGLVRYAVRKGLIKP